MRRAPAPIRSSRLLTTPANQFIPQVMIRWKVRPKRTRHQSSSPARQARVAWRADSQRHTVWAPAGFICPPRMENDLIRAAKGEALRFAGLTALPFSGDECLIWPYGRDRKGYGVMRAEGRKQCASRYVCRRAHGEPASPDLQAAHSCGNGHLGCVNPKHLRWATAKENTADTIVHGKSGLISGRSLTARLTAADAQRIRALKGKMTLVDIGKMYGIGAPHVCRIFKGEKWRQAAA